MHVEIEAPARVTDVFLDVDGVINAVWPRSTMWPWPEPAKTVQPLGFRIHYAEPLIAALNTLAEREDVRFHWLTTWEHDAPRELCPMIGLNGTDWPVLEAGERYKFDWDNWWKHPVAQAHFEANGNRFIWIDDDLIDTRAREWAGTLGDKALLIQPDPEVGLTPDHLELIEEFLEAIA